jgi:arylsulfatase A-like enzyme
MRKVLIFTAAFLASPAAAQTPPPPKLLIVISVDQFSADLFDEYQAQFTGGLAKLARGVAYRNGFQSHATTETCPGHSTILTGRRPANTGIVANAWWSTAAPRADKVVYCAEDEREAGSSSAHYKVSAVHLRVPTLGELLKQQSPASRTVAVAGKDRAAVMMGGHSPDQRWYWSGKGFVSDVDPAVPPSVAATNAAVLAAIARPQPPLDPPPFCAARSQVFAVAGGGKPVGDGRFARAAGDTAAFQTSPQYDGAVLALSAALIREMKLGRGPAPDLLTIGLSATDYVGHSYGTEGQEMCLQLLSLDRSLGDFFELLDSWGVDYAVALTADHGGLDIPERLRAHGVADAARIDPKLKPRLIGEAVAKQLGLSGPILDDLGATGDLYLDANLTGADRTRASDAVIAAYRAHPQVAAVFARDEIMRTPMPSGDPVKWSLIERVRASFDPERSGDIYVVLKPHITPISDTSRSVATHGSPWDYDRRVPILFWRKNLQPAAPDDDIETVEIMPTLATWLGVHLAPGSTDGRCLRAAGSCN